MNSGSELSAKIAEWEMRGMTQPNTADGRSMHERCDQNFSADGLSSTEKCDISTDGKTRQPFYELRSIKLK